MRPPEKSEGLQETEDPGEGGENGGGNEGQGSGSGSARVTRTSVDMRRVPNGRGSCWYSKQESAEPTWRCVC